MRAAQSLFQRRFMRRLSVGTKLWISTAILAAPLLGLGFFYVQSLTSTLWFTDSEERGLSLLQPLDEFERSIFRHADLEGVALSADSSASAAMLQLVSQADRQLALFVALEARRGNAATHGEMADLTQKWEALKMGHPGSIQESLSSHNDLLDAAAALRAQIAADWQLRLDSELAAYDLIDVALMKMPDIVRYVGETRARLADAYSRKELTADDGYRIATLMALVGDRLVSTREELTSAAQSATGRPGLANLVNVIATDWDTPADAWLAQVSKVLRATQPTPQAIRTLIEASNTLWQSMTAVQDQTIVAANFALRQRHKAQATRATIALTGSAVAMILSIMLMLALAKRIAGAIRRLLHITERIGAGQYDNAIDDSGVDEISRLYAGVSHMQKQLKTQIESERAQSIANGRIRAALDNVSGNVMVADAHGEIIYTNGATDLMLRNSEADFRKELPQFSAASVLGANFNIFHKNPAHAHSVLGELAGTRVSQLRIGGRVFRVTFNPVLSAGERVGTVVEWLDRTAEVSVEGELQQMLAGVLAGDLGKRISTADKSGFFETMCRGVNQLADNMADMVSKVKAAADEVLRGAEEMIQGNMHLSQRTEQQASSLEETASSMEEMTSSVKQNADNAGEASQLASAARDQARNGGSVVGEAIEAMARINQSSKQIADIIGVIDEIAFQTNLLALNAAVEAARAGEQGRGFAVVATEVRSLAGRSATAAKQIKELISDSVRKVQDGSVLVTRSGTTLGQIVISVKKVSDIVAEIAAASREQSSGIDLVNSAVMQMDEMTQQNAALVEEATAASKSMAEQASELNNLMERYRVPAVSNLPALAARSNLALQMSEG
jgi:methyl-accepting chemotaxis protein